MMLKNSNIISEVLELSSDEVIKLQQTPSSLTLTALSGNGEFNNTYI